MENEQNAEGARYPGVFVTRKKKTAKFAETSTTLCIPFSFADEMSDFEWDKETTEKLHSCRLRQSDSPSSELGSEQCLSSDTSCQHRFHQLIKDGDLEGADYDDKNQKRPKRKKGKDKKPESLSLDLSQINAAVDAIRYKTKMCKNWQLYEKCPYGPRCLFAHGAKELRTYAVNQTAITTAASSESPERQFYALGHFPSFIPVPFLPEDAVSDGHGENPQKPEKCREDTPSPKPLSETCCPVMTPALQVTTHSPYTAPPSPPPPVPAAAPVSPPSPTFSSLPTSFPYPGPSPFLPPLVCQCQPCTRLHDLLPNAVPAPPPTRVVTCNTPPPMVPILSSPPSPTPPSPFPTIYGAPTMLPCAAPHMLSSCPVFISAPPQCVAMPCAMQMTPMPQVAFPWQMTSPNWSVTLGMDPRMYW